MGISLVCGLGPGLPYAAVVDRAVEEALEQVKAAQSMTDNKPVFSFYATAVYFALGRSREALQQLEKGMSASPRLLKKLIALNPALLQHAQVVDLAARYKKNRSI